VPVAQVSQTVLGYSHGVLLPRRPRHARHRVSALTHLLHALPSPPLQLSHIAAALLDIYGPIIVGFCVTFAGPDALKGSLVNSLKEVQPTIFFGVPRVFEKVRRPPTAAAAPVAAAADAVAGLGDSGVQPVYIPLPAPSPFASRSSILRQ